MELKDIGNPGPAAIVFVGSKIGEFVDMLAKIDGSGVPCGHAFPDSPARGGAERKAWIEGLRGAAYLEGKMTKACVREWRAVFAPAPHPASTGAPVPEEIGPPPLPAAISVPVDPDEIPEG